MMMTHDLEAELKHIINSPNEPWRWSSLSYVPDLNEWRDYRHAWRGYFLVPIVGLVVSSAIVIVATVIAPANAQTFQPGPMTFRLASDGGTAGNSWIAADGEITKDTPIVFRQFLAIEKIQRGARYEVYFNSPGGTLLSGLELGEAIREFGFGTRVARSVKTGARLNSYEFETDAPGVCYSACSLSFLGGKWRIALERTIGVHQHYTAEALKDLRAKNFTAFDLSTQQVVAGVLADYVVRMGVDARFLTLASIASPSEMYLFSSEEMKQLGITWNDLEYSDWLLEPYKDGLVAVSKTRNGEQVATLFCQKDRTLRLLIARPNRGRFKSDEKIIANTTVNLFGYDITPENISSRIDEGHIRLEFKLPAGLDPAYPKSTRFIPGTIFKGMFAFGSSRHWFEHDLPDKNFAALSKLVGKNCI